MRKIYIYIWILASYMSILASFHMFLLSREAFEEPIHQEKRHVTTLLQLPLQQRFQGVAFAMLQQA